METQIAIPGIDAEIKSSGPASYKPWPTGHCPSLQFWNHSTSLLESHWPDTRHGARGRQETRNMSEQWATLCYTSSHHSSSLNFTTMTTMPTKRWECPANSWSLDISPPLPFSLSLSSACVCLRPDWAEAYSLCHLPGLCHTPHWRSYNHPPSLSWKVEMKSEMKEPESEHCHCLGLTRLGPIDWSLMWMLLTLWICSHSPLTRNHSECKRDTRVTQRRGRSQIRAEE